MVSATGITSGLLPATLDVTVIVPWYDPWLIPAVFTVAISVDGVVPEAMDAASQLGDVVKLNGSVELPIRLTDWLPGFAPPLWAVKVKLLGLAASAGLLETTSVTGIVSGEFEALALVMVILAL